MRSNVNFKNDDVLQSYIAQIKAIPLLNAAQEAHLAEKVKNGSESAKKSLVEANLRLVIKICMSYKVRDVSFMDIIQEGNIGLMHAASKFDLQKNVRFSTYAALWIKHFVSRFLESKCRTIHIPVQKEEFLRKISVTEANLKQILGRTPTTTEIAAELGCDESKIIEILGISSNMVSLEASLDETNDGYTYSEIYKDFKQISPEDEFLLQASDNETRNFLNRHLDKRENAIILQRFNFHKTGCHTFKKIGEQLGISAEAVRQIEKKAIRKIRASSDELADCVYA
ncbi:MAG: RNA polymerase sigma factor RpoD [Termitinemataceae bacterium]|nr:MAG: RNA polymerase sigma factor RpoD [Termitinemataceae bacterium]